MSNTIVMDIAVSGGAWARVELALRRSPFWIVMVRIPAGPVPALARVERTYLPPGKKRQRRERIDGEGQTVAEALHALAAQLEARRLNA